MYCLGCLFDPHTSVVRPDSFSLRVSVISGRHLHRLARSCAACNSFVKVEVLGCPTDCAYGNTSVVQVPRSGEEKPFFFQIKHTWMAFFVPRGKGGEIPTCANSLFRLI